MRFLLALTLLVMLATNVELSRKRKTQTVNVAAAFQAANITNFTVPQGFLKVTFGQNITVNLGNEIYSGDTINIPSIEYNNVNPYYYYTLFILDIDYPSAADPYQSPGLRALWVNIVNLDLQAADLVAGYVPSTAPPGTGLHRIVYYLYSQAAAIDAEAINFLSVELSRFDLEGFVKNYNLCLEAGNYYLIQFPDNLRETCIAEICEA